MVEFGNNLDPDKEFDVFHGLLDFSLDDCFEEGEIADDWDIGDPLCLGPIPSGILMELPLMSNEEFDFASNSGASEQKQLPKERKLVWAQESGSFHTQRSVTVLETFESDNAITERSKSKGLRDLDTNSELSTSKRTSNARRRRESRKKLPVAMDLMRNSPRSVDNSLNVSDPAYQIVKKCAHCQSSETTLWRDGPLGPKTLCNTCGLQYKSGCLFPEYQPLSSPTFVPSQHLNSQRKVAEMRNKAKRLKVEIKIDGAPEQTQLHVDNTSSHVSLLENSRSYLKFRSNYINHAGVHLVNNDKSLYGSDHVLLKNGSNPCPPLVKKKKKKKCALCESTETPEWKAGPLGPRTLCNACGILYQAGLLFPEYQPKANPTSVPSQHSNDDRNLVNSRAKPINDSLAADIKVTGASEQKQLPKQRKLARVQESGSFHTQSPVLVLDSSESDDDAIPSQSRAKRLRDIGINPELSTSRQTSNARRSKESRNAMNLMRTSPKNVDNSLNVSDPAYQIASKPRPPLVKKCAHCQSSKTTIWRDGPLGPKTLCNACGLRYKSGSLFPDYRPLSNPTFVPSQHSNSHKKVAKMRNKANQYTAGCLVTEYRPKASPTFVLSQHSNDYRICMKTRAKAMNDSLTADVKIDGAPELADHTGAGAKSCVSPPSPRKKTSCEEKLFEVPIEYDDDNSNGALLQSASKHVKQEGAKPSVPPPSPCKKTSYEEKLFEKPIEHNDDNLDSALLQNTSNPCPAVIKKCSHCESTKTRKWRRGPLGPRTLCNACGLQYRAGRLVPEYRPKASPTFVPGLHSNCPPRLMKIGT